MNVNEWFGHWAEVREGMWSLGTVARHIANAEEGWFRFAVTRELAEWPAEYSAADYSTVDAVKTLLSLVHARTEAFLETVDVTQLERTHEMPWGGQLSLRWVIWHVLEHEIHHRGEIYLMLGLTGLEAPDV